MTLNFDVMVCVCLCPRVVFVLQGKVKFRHLRELEPLHVPRPTTATVRCQTPVRIWMCCVNLCRLCVCVDVGVQLCTNCVTIPYSELIRGLVTPNRLGLAELYTGCW
jgi:hypothetical protein